MSSRGEPAEGDGARRRRRHHRSRHGQPDLPTPPHILDKLVETVTKPRTNRYSASRGIAGLRRAQAAITAAASA
jgi:aspartate/methionine/tyrosine aminotransferase